MDAFIEEQDNVESEYALPPDYDEQLGNPDAPIPNRRLPPQLQQEMAASPNAMLPSRSMTPIQHEDMVREYDSSLNLFDEDAEFVDDETPQPPSPTRLQTRGSYRDAYDLDLGLEDLEDGLQEDMDAVDGVELEDQILQEQTTASNAYNLLGMSFGSLGMMRHMNELESRKLSNGMMRASMTLMGDAIDGAMWQDRLLFILHTVTVNWLLLWLMFFRFMLVAIAATSMQFRWNQMGLGIYVSLTFDAVDLTLACILILPVLAAVSLEIYLNGYSNYIGDSIGNSFDLFLLLPLLTAGIVLHACNLANVATQVPHISKLTVSLIWPVLSVFLFWRIWRLIGSRVTLNENLNSSHALAKSVDFFWVAKTTAEDSWLIKELLPLATTGIVRLHRFITREGEKTEPWMLNYERIPLKTTYNIRPNWDEVMSALVERTKSGSAVGVFFCGPDAMKRMIQQAAITAMAKGVENAIQRGYNPAQAAATREEDLGFSRREDRSAPSRGPAGSHNRAGDDLPDPAAYGCAVRILVRAERFN